MNKTVKTAGLVFLTILAIGTAGALGRVGGREVMFPRPPSREPAGSPAG
ncbi:MAG: hypothetical protein ACR2FO_00445 [Actinomycetota bacterium]